MSREEVQMPGTTNDNQPKSRKVTLTADQRSSMIEELEQMLGESSREDILCVLMTVTVNAIHVIENKVERKQVEEEYIKALRFLSAVEEQFQSEDIEQRPDWAERCVGKMMRHVFRAIGSGIEIPE
jgi:hypothetical protein